MLKSAFAKKIARVEGSQFRAANVESAGEIDSSCEGLQNIFSALNSVRGIRSPLYCLVINNKSLNFRKFHDKVHYFISKDRFKFCAYIPKSK